MKEPRNLAGLINTGDEPTTSADTFDGLVLKRYGHTIKIPRKFMVNGSKQVSVKTDVDEYALLRFAAECTGLNHREIFLEAFDLWVKANVSKLK